MLKSIATACSEYTEKSTKTRPAATHYIVSNLMDFFGNDWKEIKTQIEKTNIYICKKYCTA